MVPPTAPSFCIADTFAQPLAQQGIAIESCIFNLKDYHPDCYWQLGVPLPERVSGAVPKRQAEYLAGRHCAAKALALLGIDNTEVKSGENRIPQWPQGAVGSITHAVDTHAGSAGPVGRAVAVAALAGDYLGVGVDCEMLVANDVAERIYESIAVPEDTELLACSNCSKEWFLTLLFSAKESLFKALYPTVGHYFGFHKARLVEFNQQGFTLALTDDLNNNWRRGMEFSGTYLNGDNYLLTLILVNS